VLAKAYRGELVPTEAELARRENRSYEPASELLARIEMTQLAPSGGSKRKTKPVAAKQASND
jgi:type I restriction enzyme S subunit